MREKRENKGGKEENIVLQEPQTLNTNHTAKTKGKRRKEIRGKRLQRGCLEKNYNQRQKGKEEKE